MTAMTPDEQRDALIDSVERLSNCATKA